MGFDEGPRIFVPMWGIPTYCQALRVPGRFHITMHLNQAVDQVRRAERGRLRAAA